MKELNRPADDLIQLIKQLHKRRDGKDLTDKQVLSEATKIIKDRI